MGVQRPPELVRLAEIVARLRAPDGCPWDRAQTHATLTGYLLEETYEVLEAIEIVDDSALQEELGDLLFQVVLHAQLAFEREVFDLHDVITRISEKMVRRHPHVFGDEPSDIEIVPRRWDELKAAEGKPRFGGLPRALPALLRAQRVGEKVARLGFDWPNMSGVLAKLDEELTELDDAVRETPPGVTGASAAVQEELGDVLFTVVNLARHLGVDAEDALRRTTNKFTRRFDHMEASLEAGGESVEVLDLDALEAAWQRAKVALRDRGAEGTHD